MGQEKRRVGPSSISGRPPGALTMRARCRGDRCVVVERLTAPSVSSRNAFGEAASISGRPPGALTMRARCRGDRCVVVERLTAPSVSGSAAKPPVHRRPPQSDKCSRIGRGFRWLLVGGAPRRRIGSLSGRRPNLRCIVGRLKATNARALGVAFDGCWSAAQAKVHICHTAFPLGADVSLCPPRQRHVGGCPQRRIRDGLPLRS